MYEFEADRLEKLAMLRDAGVEPYPSGLHVTHTSTALHARFAGVEDPATATDPAFEKVSVGGRLMFRNRMGKAMFLRLQDRGEATVDGGVDAEGAPIKRGGIIQIWVKQDDVGPERFELLKGLEIGDIVWAEGAPMRTKTGELTIRASDVQLASKILTTFPDRFHGVTDVELRSRQRYVDLFMNDASRDTFRKRSQVVRAIREFFAARDFLEVETPMMHVIPGGAAARPFTTHHNALDMPLYLRIAPELYLKRLIVGGLERVFEINRSFRNEGVSVKHNPEFTMLEFYWAWATWEDLMVLTEDLLGGLVDQVLGNRQVDYQGRTLNFETPFRRADMDALISETVGLSAEALQDPAQMLAFWKSKHEKVDEAALPSTVGRWWELLFEEYVEHTLINPTFVTGFPTEISPLSRKRDADPTRVDRFELIVNGWELANAFSELNDPVDQAARFEDQVAARDAGDDEGMHFDADYIRALSYAMPPTAGQGIGIDRLVMLLTNRTSIREVILFPTLRPEKGSAAE